MSSLLQISPLFAQISRWQRLGDGIHRGRGRMDLIDLWPLALILALAAIAMFAVVTIRKRNDMTQRCDDPNKLFRELSLAHNLDRASQNLLWQLAEAFQLTQPAEVFLQPALFATEQLPQHLRDHESRIADLREQLF